MHARSWMRILINIISSTELTRIMEILEIIRQRNMHKSVMSGGEEDSSSWNREDGRLVGCSFHFLTLLSGGYNNANSTD